MSHSADGADDLNLSGEDASNELAASRAALAELLARPTRSLAELLGEPAPAADGENAAETTAADESNSNSSSDAPSLVDYLRSAAIEPSGGSSSLVADGSLAPVAAGATGAPGDREAIVSELRAYLDSLRSKQIDLPEDLLGSDATVSTASTTAAPSSSAGGAAATASSSSPSSSSSRPYVFAAPLSTAVRTTVAPLEASHQQQQQQQQQRRRPPRTHSPSSASSSAAAAAILSPSAPAASGASSAAGGGRRPPSRSTPQRQQPHHSSASGGQAEEHKDASPSAASVAASAAAAAAAADEAFLNPSIGADDSELPTLEPGQGFDEEAEMRRIKELDDMLGAAEERANEMSSRLLALMNEPLPALPEALAAALQGDGDEGTGTLALMPASPTEATAAAPTNNAAAASNAQQQGVFMTAADVGEEADGAAGAASTSTANTAVAESESKASSSSAPSPPAQVDASIWQLEEVEPLDAPLVVADGEGFKMSVENKKKMGEINELLEHFRSFDVALPAQWRPRFAHPVLDVPGGKKKREQKKQKEKEKVEQKKKLKQKKEQEEQQQQEAEAIAAEEEDDDNEEGEGAGEEEEEAGEDEGEEASSSLSPSSAASAKPLLLLSPTAAADRVQRLLAASSSTSAEAGDENDSAAAVAGEGGESARSLASSVAASSSSAAGGGESSLLSLYAAEPSLALTLSDAEQNEMRKLERKLKRLQRERAGMTAANSSGSGSGANNGTAAAAGKKDKASVGVGKAPLSVDSEALKRLLAKTQASTAQRASASSSSASAADAFPTFDFSSVGSSLTTPLVSSSASSAPLHRGIASTSDILRRMEAEEAASGKGPRRPRAQKARQSPDSGEAQGHTDRTAAQQDEEPAAGTSDDSEADDDDAGDDARGDDDDAAGEGGDSDADVPAAGGASRAMEHALLRDRVRSAGPRRPGSSSSSAASFSSTQPLSRDAVVRSSGSGDAPQSRNGLSSRGSGGGASTQRDDDVDDIPVSQFGMSSTYSRPALALTGGANSLADRLDAAIGARPPSSSGAAAASVSGAESWRWKPRAGSAGSSNGGPVTALPLDSIGGSPGGTAALVRAAARGQQQQQQQQAQPLSSSRMSGGAASPRQVGVAGLRQQQPVQLRAMPQMGSASSVMLHSIPASAGVPASPLRPSTGGSGSSRPTSASSVDFSLSTGMLPPPVSSTKLQNNSSRRASNNALSNSQSGTSSTWK